MPASPTPTPAAPPAARKPTGTDLVRRRHAEWQEHQLKWRWLLDSLEGGERYRQAIYGFDRRGVPVRNLIRHKREYPDPTEADGTLASVNGYGPGGPAGADPAYPATDDDYELRRARTPVPTFVKEAITDHLDRVFAREVGRDGQPLLIDWWADVDGRGTPIDAWVHEILGPVLLATGCCDVGFDHPAAPEGEEIRTQADVERLGLGRCLASLILPENLVWWRLDARGDYTEALVREYPDGADLPDSLLGTPTDLAPATPVASGATAGTYLGTPTDLAPATPVASGATAGTYLDTARYRHWTAGESVLYDARGRELARRPHAFGRVPIVRVFSRRKPRCEHVGQSDYEGVAERQREYYNRDSELILSDTTQAHPLLQGPEDFITAEGTIPVGPSWLLPKKKNTQGGSASYEGFDVVDFPKGGAESLRANKADLRDEVDRDAALNKPAGTSAGSAGAGVVAQSGISKGFDNARLNNKLCAVAKTLAGAEKRLAAFALTVLMDGPVDAAVLDAVTVEYSQQFDLSDVNDLGAMIGGILKVAADPAAGRLPEVTGEFLKTMVRQALPGRDDLTYGKYDAEIDAALVMAKRAAEQAALNPDAAADPNATAPPPGAPGAPAPANGPPTAPTPPAESGPVPTSLGDLADAISLFDRANPDLKGMLDARKAK